MLRKGRIGVKVDPECDFISAAFFVGYNQWLGIGGNTIGRV